MRCETVITVDLLGEYKIEYAGNMRSEARRIYRELAKDKSNFLYLFQQSGYVSRTISRDGFNVDASKRLDQEEPKRLKKPKKESEI